MKKEKVIIWARWVITCAMVIAVFLYQTGRGTVPFGVAEGSTIEETVAEGDSSDTAQADTSGTAQAIQDYADPSDHWEDGVWEGEAAGYGGPISVSVTIEQGYIVAVDIVSAEGEDAPYLRDARKIIPKILKNQHTDLDAISGATTTTWGILDAVDAALEEAHIE